LTPGLRTRGRIEADVGASVDDILDRNLEEMSAGETEKEVFDFFFCHFVKNVQKLLEPIRRLLNLQLQRQRSM
jgi:chromosomal replication initiation ATPase DnaA